MPHRKTKAPPAHPPTSFFYTTRFQLVLYSLLLIATPFLLVRNYLQPAIGKISTTQVPIDGTTVPLVLLVVVPLVATAAVIFRRRLTWLRLAAGAAALLMVALSQVFADYYYDHAFYELQQNWHYVAYTLFAFMVYRDLHPRGFPIAKIMWVTAGCAIVYSTFDEVFQMLLSSRVFDVGDIAKDFWGALIGLVMLYIGSRELRVIRSNWKHIRHPRIRGYTRSPASTLTLLLVWGLLFVMISSLLTDPPYWKVIALFTILSAGLFSLLLHLSQYRRLLRGFGAVIVGLLLIQSYFLIAHRSDHIVQHKYGLTVYKGIPIPYFDVAFFPDGAFRLVDKKHYFHERDRTTLLRKEPDILLIGSGDRDLGGRGFPDRVGSQFVFNRFRGSGTQVIILPSPEAWRLYNRLKRENKNVLFVLHNTC